MSKETDEIKKAFESNEKFFEFLKQNARYESKDRQVPEYTPHPSRDMIRDYVKGFLNDKQEKEVGDHILVCDDCTDKVFQMTNNADWMEKLASIPASVQAMFSDKSEKPRMYLLSGFGMAAVCLILYLIWPPSLSNMLDKSFQIVLTQEISIKNNIELPWDKPDKSPAFAPVNRDAPAYRAFAAGMWTGSQSFSKEKNPWHDFLSPGWPDNTSIEAGKWSDTGWSVYFQMGQWCYLLQAVCGADTKLSYEFWEQQALILDKIERLFEHSPKTPEDLRFVKDRFEKLKSVFKELNQDIPDKRQCRIITDEAGGLTDHMGPPYVPRNSVR
ncbi:MAG: hypothetical protein GY795_50400 [Desulfobacterales bacterium]|nr:hypothetical protein [Desulfobacterales bacterium]